MSERSIGKLNKGMVNIYLVIIHFTSFLCQIHKHYIGLYIYIYIYIYIKSKTSWCKCYCKCIYLENQVTFCSIDMIKFTIAGHFCYYVRSELILTSSLYDTKLANYPFDGHSMENIDSRFQLYTNWYFMNNNVKKIINTHIPRIYIYIQTIIL